MQNSNDEPQRAMDPFRVLVVDDSAVIRGLISRWLEEDPTIAVVATASNGQMALNSLVSSDAEVVVLDIEMPVMDGLTALPRMLREVPDIQILMASTLTNRNAEISMKALGLGAADYVPKPETNKEVTGNSAFRREIVDKVRALAGARRQQRKETMPSLGRPAQTSAAPAAAPKDGSLRTTSLHLFTQVEGATNEIRLRSASKTKPAVLSIGSSTGGPQALVAFFSGAKHFLSGLPVLVTQHMPPAFTSILASHIGKASGMDAHEAVDGERLKPGVIYIAPGDYHMTVREELGTVRIRLNQDAPENFCRPAADPMLRSLSEVFGNRALTVILTGMGHDGLAGSKAIIEAGGTVVAQDEASSVVWGMPGSVAVAGVCSAVLPLNDLGPTVGRFIMGGQL